MKQINKCDSSYGKRVDIFVKGGEKYGKIEGEQSRRHSTEDSPGVVPGGGGEPDDIFGDRPCEEAVD